MKLLIIAERRMQCCTLCEVQSTSILGACSPKNISKRNNIRY